MLVIGIVLVTGFIIGGIVGFSIAAVIGAGMNCDEIDVYDD
jgi:hypothetical protein